MNVSTTLIFPSRGICYSVACRHTMPMPQHSTAYHSMVYLSYHRIAQRSIAHHIIAYLSIRIWHTIAYRSIPQYIMAQQSVALTQHQHSIREYIMAQHSIAQHSTSQHSMAQHSRAYRTIAQYSMAQRSMSIVYHGIAQRSINTALAQHSVAVTQHQHSIRYYIMAQHGIAQHGIAQNDIAQHSIAQHTAHDNASTRPSHHHLQAEIKTYRYQPRQKTPRTSTGYISRPQNHHETLRYRDAI